MFNNILSVVNDTQMMMSLPLHVSSRMIICAVITLWTGISSLTKQVCVTKLIYNIFQSKRLPGEISSSRGDFALGEIGTPAERPG